MPSTTGTAIAAALTLLESVPIKRLENDFKLSNNNTVAVGGHQTNALVNPYVYSRTSGCESELDFVEDVVE